jgi:hypothetical protein
MCSPEATALHELQAQQGSPPDGFMQFTTFASILAAVVLPQPLGPEKR